MNEVQTLSVKLAVAWWVTPALKCLIAWWIVRAIFTGRAPAEAEIEAAATRIAYHGVRLQVLA